CRRGEAAAAVPVPERLSAVGRTRKQRGPAGVIRPGRGCSDARLFARGVRPTQLAVAPSVLPTEVNVLLALLPRVVMAAMHTTMIRASMTAYSTAVGPSSRFRNFTTLLVNFFIAISLR